MNKIEELKAAYEAATGGEWEDSFRPGCYSEGAIFSGGNLIAIIAGSNYGAWRAAEDNGDAEFAANARLIALTHSALPALLECAKALGLVLAGEPFDLIAARAALEKLK